MRKILLLILLISAFLPIFASSIETSNDSTQHEQHNWIVQNELLFWIAHQDGLAFTDKPSDVLTTDDFTKTSRIHPDFEWDCGYRIIVGYLPDCSRWVFSWEWTSINNQAHRKERHNSGPSSYEGSFPVWSLSPQTLAGDYVSKSRFNWHIHSNIFDFNIQYRIYLKDRFELRPLIGIRGPILNQKLHAIYEGGTFYSDEDENVARNHFWGVGPRFGLEGIYSLCNNFKLIGFVAATPMYGHFKVSHKEFYLDEKIYSHSHTNSRFAWCFDYRVGLQWQGQIQEFLPEMLLGIAWEGHIFYKQNRMQRSDFDFNSGSRNLRLEGVTFSASLCF